MRVCEFIHRLTAGGLTVRVWAQADDHFHATTQAVQRIKVQRLMDQRDAAGWSVAQLADQIAQAPWVNAVEVTEADGQGLLIYPDWP